MFRKGLIACAIGAMLTAGIGLAKTHVYVQLAPPAAVVERVPPSPGGAYVWTPGYYSWTGHAYVWKNGRWMMPPKSHARYTAGRWEHDRHGWYYRTGHWR